jgi:hypothetical protein
VYGAEVNTDDEQRQAAGMCCSQSQEHPDWEFSFVAEERNSKLWITIHATNHQSQENWVFTTTVYWTQNICEPELRHSKRGRGDEKGKG